ncbi:MAG: hypothetical protein ACYTE1_06710, partial [Planctomycetota bacterium]
KYHTFLKPGGSLLLDVHSLNIFNEKQESATCELNQLNGFWSPNTYYGFVNSFKYDKEKVSLDKYTIIEKNRTRTVYNCGCNISAANHSHMNSQKTALMSKIAFPMSPELLSILNHPTWPSSQQNLKIRKLSLKN